MTACTLQGSKMARQLALMRMRSTALGDPATPAADRLYLHVGATTAPPRPVFVARTMSAGKVCDVMCFDDVTDLTLV